MRLSQLRIDGVEAAARPARLLWPAMLNGLRCRCPHCGEGRLFRSFLQTETKCERCGEEFHHHRADDLPAYLVIVIVGHVMVGAFMGVEVMTSLSTWQHLAIWIPVTVLATIALLQPVKGSIVGLQWALYMHGFGGHADELETHPEL
jgi:uncharacterized protein (DUF983 family)